MGCVEGSGVPVLYIGRTVPKGYNVLDGSVRRALVLGYQLVRHPVIVATKSTFSEYSKSNILS
jgi:hypothetical protein